VTPDGLVAHLVRTNCAVRTAPPAGNVPLPAGTRLQRDADTMVLDGGRTLVGGTPLRLVRLRDRASDVVGPWLAGSPVSDARGDRLLARRLVWLGLFHARPPGTGLTAKDVTVVIPVRDRPEQLRVLLRSLNGLTTIVVDDGSRDAAAVRAAARNAEATLVTLPRNLGPAAARNAGLARACSALVAFVDTDCLPLPGWLDPLLEHFDDELVAAAAPRILPGSPPERNWTVALELARPSLDRGDRAGIVRPMTRIPFVPTAALVVRRDCVGHCCFDEELRVGEDVDFVWRLDRAGWLVQYDPTSTVAHLPREGPGAWLAQRTRYGTSAGPLARRHPDNLAPASVSASTAAVLGLVALRRPYSAALVAGGSAALTARRLTGATCSPTRLAARLFVRGTLTSSTSVVAGLARAWGPVLVIGFALPPTRRIAAAALLAPALAEWARARPRPGLDPVRFVLAHVADTLAYGTGVWIGCARAKTVRPLLPSVARRRVPSRTRRGPAAQPAPKRTIPRMLRPAIRSS
jgi:mycofactocin system glycosyltransferase